MKILHAVLSIPLLFSCGSKKEERDPTFEERAKGLSLTQCTWLFHCENEKDANLSVNICKEKAGDYALQSHRVTFDEDKKYVTLHEGRFMVVHADEVITDKSFSYKIREKTYGYGGEFDPAYQDTTLFSIDKDTGNAKIESDAPFLSIDFPNKNFHCVQKVQYQ